MEVVLDSWKRGVVFSTPCEVASEKEVRSEILGPPVVLLRVSEKLSNFVIKLILV